MKDLYIDIETYSSVNLKDCGVYKYSESADSETTLFGFSIDGSPVEVIDLAQGESIPSEITNSLSDPSVTKWAHNASFERVFLSKWLNPDSADYLDPKGWKCSMVWCAYLGLPLSLEQSGAVLKVSQQKLAEGKDLVRYFCTPCKPTKTNGGRTRNLPEHNMSQWDRFREYNKTDVECEMEIISRLSKYPVPDSVWEEYWISERINDRGILVDEEFVRNAVKIDSMVKGSLSDRMKDITGLENPNSVMQLRNWLMIKGVAADSLDKKAVAALLKDAPPDVAEVLSLRQMTSKSSIKKYVKMMMTMCADGRVRGMFQFYGASRTGRWAGRHVQLQNLPQNHLPDLAEARELVRRGDIESLEMLYDDIPDVLSQLIRTAFIPADGYKFIVSDFSSVEARVLAFVAQETWKIKAFAEGRDIYCATAEKMFHVPVEKNGINGSMRMRGKIAELGLGYGSSVNGLKKMGALEQGLSEDELQPLVDAWREANPCIVEFWWDIDDAIKKAVRGRTRTSTHGIGFAYKSGTLFVTLPSGRRLAYVKPRIEPNQYGGESMTYFGLDQSKKYVRLESYGAKVCENIIQGISRDLLAEALKRLSGMRICAHVHDEVIIEASMDMEVGTVETIMGETPEWIKGLLLRADGYECSFYMKA